MRRRSLLAGMGAAAAVSPVRAQAAWPTRPLRLVVPWPPGGTTDILARQIAPPLGAALGQPVVVENRGGASGAIGTTELLRGAPDGGHGFAFVTSTLVSAALLSKQPYHPVDDVAPILRLADVANILVVNNALPIRSVSELIAYARERPGRLAFGSPGIGSAVHISGETFKLATGVDMVHAPYRGGGPALTDLVGGQIQLMFGTASSTLPYVRSGAVRPLAVTSAHRAAYLPEVPTIAESGVPGFDVVEWYAAIGPAQMPPAVAERLNRELMAIVGTPEGRAKLLEGGAEVVGGTPAEFGAFLRGEMDKIGRVVRDAKISLE